MTKFSATVLFESISERKIKVKGPHFLGKGVCVCVCACMCVFAWWERGSRKRAFRFIGEKRNRLLIQPVSPYFHGARDHSELLKK